MFYVIIFMVKLYHIQEIFAMSDITKTMKLHIHPDDTSAVLFRELTERYSCACNEISRYVFDHGFILNFMALQDKLYRTIRDNHGLKAQMTISALKTVTARYKTVREQLYQNPYRYKDSAGRWKYITRTLEWLQRPICFHRPQADLVRGRDYSFVGNGSCLSINTLSKRVKVSFDIPDYFTQYFDGTWSFGTAKLVSLKGEWYFHIPMTKTVPDTFDTAKPSHVVGIDRGLRFIAATYDETGHCDFMSGRDIMHKRDTFAAVRAELQSRGTKSAKRKLKTISGRENRWMTDINHQLSKTLVARYGKDTLFVLEDLTGVSFDETSLSDRSKHQRGQIRSWSFYQLEQMLTYKALEAGSSVVKVSAEFTSQRCPKCGRIHKENRHHNIHEYICDACGYRSNDDRVGAMNIYTLGTMYVSGDANPRFGPRKQN